MGLRRTIVVLALTCFAGCGGCDDESGKTDPNSDTPDANTDKTDTSTSSDAGDGTDTSSSSDASTSPDADDSRASYCAGSGPPVLQPGTAQETCTGELAAVAFRFALCSCDSFTAAGRLTTASMDSADMMSGQSASVGTNGDLIAANGIQIGGSLWVAGDGGITFGGGEAEVTGDLRSGGRVSSGSDITVGHDLDVDGMIQAGGSISVARTVTQTPNENRTVAGGLTAANDVRAQVTVNDPCDCEPSLLIPVADIVAAMGTTNDNDEIGLDPGAYGTGSGAGSKQIDLPCGRFYLDELTASGDVTITVDGRTALFIGGDLRVSSELNVFLENGGELDLFIAGDVTIAGDVVIGDPARPAATRIYVGGSGRITIASDVEFNANLYAPTADVQLASDTEVRGAIFAKSVTVAGALTIVYDEAILTAGDACEDDGGGSGGDPGTPDDPRTCDSCRDCNNQACTDGECGEACTSNDDCCAPLICQSGRCQVIL